MSRLLVLGGTGFVGCYVVEELLARGHRVCVLARGKTRADPAPAVESLSADREDRDVTLAALGSRMWDACIDAGGYTPRQVRPAAEALRGRIGRYVFVSAVSVYGDPQDRPVTEQHPRVAPADESVTEIDSRTYGPLKVACENIVGELYADRATLLRPQVVAGPRDPYDRFSYWVRRAAQGGALLAPGDGTDHVQVIDARDVARFAVDCVDQDRAGTFNLSGHRVTWTQFLDLLGAQNRVWVPAERIRAAGITEFELPLFRSERGPRSGLMQVCNRRALAAGLVLSELRATIEAVRDWLPGAALAPALSPEREAEILRSARSVTG